MKKIAKNFVVAILGWQVARLRRKNDFLVIGVVGSIGKTSTKFAIAKVLGSSKKVCFQEGNYNDIASVPLIFFGQELPNIFNLFAWLKIMFSNELKLSKQFNYDVVVVELGTDGPGQIANFKKYLHLDYAVVTAVTPEHMEFFSNLDAVAREELSVSQFSEKIIVNADLCDEKYISPSTLPVVSYGVSDQVDYRLKDTKFGLSKASFVVANKKRGLDLSFTMDAVSIAELYSASAAIALGDLMGMDKDQIKEGVEKLQPVAGRMQRLQGINDSLIIDETYNASPVAVKAALDSLYAFDAPHKIAVLGNMNELGDISEQAHREIGRYCDPSQLDLVVTIGVNANKFTASEAQANGCKVASFDNPYDAGKFIKSNLKKGTAILVKGSQNGVFAEETVKLLLKNPQDERLLVRQSPEWLKQKQKQFKVK